MIKKALLIINLFCGLRATAQKTAQKGYDIQVTLEGLTNGTKVYLIRFADVQTGTQDTIATTVADKQAFRFSGKLSPEGDFFTIRAAGWDKKKSIMLFMDNSDISIKGTSDDPAGVAVIGGRSHNDYELYRNTMYLPLRKRWDNMYVQLQQAHLSNDKALEEELRYSMAGVNDSISAAARQFIRKYPSSLYSAFLVYKTKVKNAADQQQLYQILSTSAQSSRYGTAAQESIQLLEKKERVELGKVIPDFEFPTLAGPSLSVQQVVRKGKLTVVDFWASWCKPCRTENPNMVKLYQAFHDKGLNILGVSLDGNRAAWEQAIASDGLTWYHISDLGGWQSRAATIFDLSSIPQTLLLDEKGTIIAKNLRGEQLYAKVQSLMQEQP